MALEGNERKQMFFPWTYAEGKNGTVYLPGLKSNVMRKVQTYLMEETDLCRMPEKVSWRSGICVEAYKRNGQGMGR